MKNIRSRSGPFAERPHFKLGEVEEICTVELQTAGLYPSRPEAVRIDRFIEKRFGAPSYESLPADVLGFTRFGPNGVEAIVIARELDEARGKVAERRLRTTLAHEGGHGLLHAHLFCLGEKPKGLFDDAEDIPRILCRDILEGPQVARAYSGRWWEFQANKAIGGLLMPRRLVEQAATEFCEEVGLLGQRVLLREKREVAVRALSETFEVNPVVARIRLEDIFPFRNDAQMLL